MSRLLLALSDVSEPNPQRSLLDQSGQRLPQGLVGSAANDLRTTGGLAIGQGASKKEAQPADRHRKNYENHAERES